MFRIVELSHLNEEKPQVFKHLRMSKAHAVRVIKPDSIILGTSRAEYGLDPNHPGWRGGVKAYNLALSSCRIYEALCYLKHAHAINPLHQVVLGLDMFMFDDSLKNEKDFDVSRLSGNGHHNFSIGWIHDMIRSLISIDATKKSFQTIFDQDRKDTILYYCNGMRKDLNSWNRIKAKGGHKRVDIELSEPRGRLKAETNKIEPMKFELSLAYFEQIIEFSLHNNIDLYLFISPVHVRSLERMYKRGSWENFEQWKIALVKALEKSVRHLRTHKNVKLWDFSDYNSITTEKFPVLGDVETQMKWFWESRHYKREVGDLILNRLFDYSQAGKPVPDDFGVNLTSENINRHLSKIRESRKQYLISNWNEISDIWEETLSDAQLPHFQYCVP